jgi:addiction module HigA family antidote
MPTEIRYPKSRQGGKLVHPGLILLQEWMEPFGITQNGLARCLALSPRRLNEICLGKRSITADTAIRLGIAFYTSPHYWMALQADYEIETRLLDPGAVFETHGGMGKPLGGAVPLQPLPFDAPQTRLQRRVGCKR